jgi:hypothetical protein
MTGGVEVTVETGGGTGSSDEVLVTTDVVDEALVSTGVVEEVLVSSDVVDEVLVSTGSADEDEVLVEVELFRLAIVVDRPVIVFMRRRKPVREERILTFPATPLVAAQPLQQHHVLDTLRRTQRRRRRRTQRRARRRTSLHYCSNFRLRISSRRSDEAIPRRRRRRREKQRYGRGNPHRSNERILLAGKYCNSNEPISKKPKN